MAEEKEVEVKEEEEKKANEEEDERQVRDVEILILMGLTRKNKMNSALVLMYLV